jgi:hypothetical protein
MLQKDVWVWGTLSSAGIAGPVSVLKTVNDDCYLKLPQDHFVSTRHVMGVNTEEPFFNKVGQDHMWRM